MIWPNRNPTPSDNPHYLRHVVESSPYGYYYLDLKSGQEEVSSRLKQMLSLEDFDSTLNAIAPHLEEGAFAALEQAVEDLKESRGETFHLNLTKNDGAGYLDCHATNIIEDDEVAAITIWFCDTTAKHMEQQRVVRESEALKQDIKQVSTLLNSLPYPAWYRNEDLSLRYCNLAYSQMAEESSDSKPEAEELELHRFAKAMAAQAQQSGTHKKERRHIVLNGERRLVEFNEVPLPDDSGLIGYAHDVTEIENIQEEMQRHISAQADLLESSTSAMSIYGSDKRLKFFNNAFVNLWKLEEAWLETHPTYSEVLEKLRENRSLPEQANFPVFKKEHLELFTNLLETHEEFFYLPDGRTLRVLAIPHALGGILFVYEDVTDRLALERSYNTLIAVQRATLDNLHEGLAVFGEDGRLRLSNPMYLKMWNINENMVQDAPHISDILERTKGYYVYDDWNQFKAEITGRLHMREVQQVRVDRSDGKMLDTLFVPLPDGATLITYIDITDSTLVERSLRERNEALQEADRLKTEFLANVSYELRSPLTSISGFAEMLKQDYFGDLTDKQREYVSAIHQASQHLMHLINDIIDIASIEAGYLRLDVNEFDIYKMMNSVLSLVEERVHEYDITVDFQCPVKIGTLVGDKVRIKQAMFNLLSNAIKYTPRGGEILFGAEARKDEEGEDIIMLWVEDHGVGIAPEEQELIFGTFYQGTSADLPKSGAGLGLSMVKGIIKLHGGHIELKSDQNIGTHITCYLPRHNPKLESYGK